MNQNLTALINDVEVKLGDIVKIDNSFFIVTIKDIADVKKAALSFATIKVTQNSCFEQLIMNDNLVYIKNKAYIFEEEVKVLGNILENKDILYELEFDYDSYAGVGDNLIINIDQVFKKGMFENIAYDVMNSFMLKYSYITK